MLNCFNLKIKQKGTNLVEFVIVIAILGILGAGAAKLLMLGMTSYNMSHDLMDADWQGRLALERITRDLHSIRSPADIQVATSGVLTFTDLNGQTVTYQKTGTQLMRNSQDLADNIQSLAFSYYDLSGTSPVASKANIRFVKVSLTINKSIAVTYNTGVFLWNLV